MKLDLYTKILLTIIAICLIKVSFSNTNTIKPAKANSAQAGWVIDTVLGCIDGSKILGNTIKLKCTSY